MKTAFYCSNFGLHLNDFNFYVMGKKYVLSSLSAILVLCNRVKSNKITSYFELFCTKKKKKISFNLFHYFFQDWLTDYSHIYRIFTLEKHFPKEFSVQMMKNSEYSNSNLPYYKIRKPEILHPCGYLWNNMRYIRGTSQVSGEWS